MQDTDKFFVEHEAQSTHGELALSNNLKVILPAKGFLSSEQVDSELKILGTLGVDDYITRVLDPVEAKSRPSAKTIISRINGKVIKQVSMGPLYAVELNILINGKDRRIGFIAQDRHANNGVWGPEHHQSARNIVREFCDHSIPIVSFIDTPGADAGAEANLNNQAHSISHLITEMCDIHVPTVGIIYGLGYSGGAIPLAATNLLLGVRSCAFNTIQPKGLANIARQYNLSWQESARYVGVSPCELLDKGIIDGVINWAPEDGGSVDPLVNAIIDSIEAIEKTTSEMVANSSDIFHHYQRSVKRFIHPSESLLKLRDISNIPVTNTNTRHPNIFGHACTHLRYLTIHQRIEYSTINSYGQLSGETIPQGDLNERTKALQEKNFNAWLNQPDQLLYIDDVLNSWKRFKTHRSELNVERNKLSIIFLGEPQENYENSRYRLGFAIGLYLYNRWKSESADNFPVLLELIQKNQTHNDTIFARVNSDLHLLDIMYIGELKQTMIEICQSMVTFDSLYNQLINNFVDIAEESRSSHVISEDTIGKLLNDSLRHNTNSQSAKVFSTWLNYFVKFRRRGEFLKTVEEWKRVYFPRLSDSLLVLITFFFESLIRNFLLNKEAGKEFDGRINPVHIGKRKDFWNQLDIAYKDVLIQNILSCVKRQKKTHPQAFIDLFFESFKEADKDLMSSNPVNFPGFRLSIEKALANNIIPCGMITGIGTLKSLAGKQVGVAISNTSFQAGAFDMASGQKLCDLLVECARLKLPVICFVSSGGMQTKEGPKSLFSMAIVNDRITRFVRDNDLPIIIFGFGDCTGGSQASFVTHPFVQTYYFSGADIPFAGRVVVPSFLPSHATVSNYLASKQGAMRGLVKHPFFDDLDQKMAEIDPSISIPVESVNDVIKRVLEGELMPETIDQQAQANHKNAIDLMKPVESVLIHARGCTAVKLIRIAQQLNKKVILVASDPDMESIPATMLKEHDELVCLGGQTSDESYLNANSVLSIAKRFNASALHPGIGFLSENDQFALQCRKDYQLNFIGPFASSMQTMGNKANAIHTAMSAKVPVVPGSHGILPSVDAAKSMAVDIGYPVLLKAVHGGGGKGIQVVRSEHNMTAAFNRVQSEARAAFGNGDLYLEKFIESMRHIEIQILRDVYGNTKVLGLRDCSVQRNNQKVLEESKSTLLSKKLQSDAFAYAERLANQVNYLGAGTVEFIFDLVNDSIYFMEMNTRLQVEHPVTEWTTNISIVSEQFRIAEHQSIEHLEPKNKGYAIEARITAEKPLIADNGNIDFIPTPGLITECSIPEYNYLEVISIADKDITISPFYDSLIAQIICYGNNRKEGVKRLINVLDKMVIKGICTNIPLLKRILTDDIFASGNYDTNYLPQLLNKIDKDSLIEEITLSSGENNTSLKDQIIIADTRQLKVLAPMTGILYLTPTPNDSAYIAEGDHFKLSNILCQIEAMKIFSPISLANYNTNDIIYADLDYRVIRINQTNGSQINSGDLLFVIEPIIS